MSKTIQKPSDRIAALTERTDELSRRWAPAVLRVDGSIVVAVQPVLEGADRLRSHRRRVRQPLRLREQGHRVSGAPRKPMGLRKPSLPPNLSVFGWITLFVEATLVALLLSGRYLSLAAVLGFVQAFGIDCPSPTPTASGTGATC